MPDQIVRLPDDSTNTGKKIDQSELTVGGNTVERQRIVLGDPILATGLANVSTSGALTIGGIQANNASTVGNPIVIAGEDGASIARAVLTDWSGTLLTASRHDVFVDILIELKRHSIALSALIGEDITDLDIDV